MRLFRIYVDGALFYHPQLSKLAVTESHHAEAGSEENDGKLHGGASQAAGDSGLF